jgi:hypothetical protein
MYSISKYSYRKAKELGVDIKPSTNENKKIDVYEKGNKVASIGDIRYNDFPTYIKSHGVSYARKRRELYHTRHKGDKGKVGYYAKEILW